MLDARARSALARATPLVPPARTWARKLNVDHENVVVGGSESVVRVFADVLFRVSFQGGSRHASDSRDRSARFPLSLVDLLRVEGRAVWPGGTMRKQFLSHDMM